MRNFLAPFGSSWRYVLVAIVAFSIGGGTVVQAVAPSGILGTVRLADRTDETRLAAVDADGNVQVKVNNLSATQQVSGTVSVDNFPATQNVNVTGGTVNARPAVATRGFFKQLLIDPNSSGIETFNTINASYIQLSQGSGGGLEIFFSGPIGLVAFTSGDHQMFFTQRVPINKLEIHCHNLVTFCFQTVSIVGD